MKDVKILELEKATEPLATYAKELGDQVLILTSDKEPVAVVVSLGRSDKESLALSLSPEFREIIETSREEIQAGETLSLNEMKGEFAVDS